MIRLLAGETTIFSHGNATLPPSTRCCVGLSVGRLIGPSVHHIIDLQVVFTLLPLPWPTVRDWGAACCVSDLLAFRL